MCSVPRGRERASSTVDEYFSTTSSSGYSWYIVLRKKVVSISISNLSTEDFLKEPFHSNSTDDYYYFLSFLPAAPPAQHRAEAPLKPLGFA